MRIRCPPSAPPGTLINKLRVWAEPSYSLKEKPSVWWLPTLGRFPAKTPLGAVPLPTQSNSLLDFKQDAGPSPYLVSTTHNSPQYLLSANRFDASKYCPNARLVEGVCDPHGNRRFVLVPCKRRDCDVCGPNGRWEIAKRIAYGIRHHWPCAWITLSFETELAEEPVWKPKAVKRLGKFVAWLRKSNPGLQYAATYELQKRGRLHINLIIGPWQSVPKADLQKRWGANLWVEWVQDDKTMGREAAKSYSP